MFPQLENGLGNNLNAIAGVTTHKHTAIVVHNLVSQLRKNIVNDIPVVIGIENCGKTCVWINLGKQSAQESNFVSVNRIVGTHNRMLGTRRAKCDRLFCAIAVIYFLQIRNSRNGCCVQERETPTSTGFNGRFQTFLSTKIECSQGSCTRNIVIAGLVVIFVYDFTISSTDSRSQHRMPHFSGNQTFKRLRQPCEIGMRICDSEHRNVHRYNSAFGQRYNLNGQIAETVECFDLFNLISILSESSIHNSSVLSHNLIKRLIEEFFVEIVDKVGLNETLQSEHYNFIPSLNSAHSRSKIRYGLCNVLGQHFCVDCLIEIN